MFITFEGGDGSGKSTQARSLASWLRDRGIDVVFTREPGGSPGAEDIRSLVLNGEVDRWSAESELLLFTAARRDHLEKTVWPALKRGAVVISDRYADSTRVYQGLRSPELKVMTDQLHDLMIGFDPDLTFILDVDPKTALDRGVARLAAAGVDEARFEKMGVEFQIRLRAGFLALANSPHPRYRLIDGSGDLATVAGRIQAELPSERLQNLCSQHTPNPILN